MSEITASGLADSVVQRLQRRAEAHGWSLQEEVKYILAEGLDHLESLEQGLRSVKEILDRPTRPRPTIDREKVQQMVEQYKPQDRADAQGSL